MPDDVGGQPIPNGEEPDKRRGGNADDAFASVVFDEAFVRAAQVHEPTAAERILAAAQTHAETEAVHTHEDGYGYGPAEAEDPDGFGGPGYAGYSPFGYAHEYEYEHGSDYGYAFGAYGDRPRPYRGHRRWQRPVAWVLAVVMGIGMVALAFTAVSRGASGDSRETTPPPATTGMDSGQDDGVTHAHDPGPAVLGGR